MIEKIKANTSIKLSLIYDLIKFPRVNDLQNIREKNSTHKSNIGITRILLKFIIAETTEWKRETSECPVRNREILKGDKHKNPPPKKNPPISICPFDVSSSLCSMR